MRSLINPTLWVGLLVAGQAIGCNQSVSPTTAGNNVGQANAGSSEASSEDRPSPGIEDVNKEMSEAADVTLKFAAKKKDEYVQQLKQQSAQLEERIEEMKANAGDLSQEAQQRWKSALERLTAARQKYQDELSELNAASGDAWSQLRDGVEAAWKDLKQATDDAAKQFDQA